MIVVATDAPLDARDLRRLAARAVFGLARTGSSYSQRQRRLRDRLLHVARGAHAPRRDGARPRAAPARGGRLAAVPGRPGGDRGGGLQRAAAGDHGQRRGRTVEAIPMDRVRRR